MPATATHPHPRLTPQHRLSHRPTHRHQRKPSTMLVNGRLIQPPPAPPATPESMEHVPLFTLLTTYLSYAILIFFGHLRDFFGKRFKSREYTHLMHQDGYAPLAS